jgi:hypothetical protein
MGNKKRKYTQRDKDDALKLLIDGESKTNVSALTGVPLATISYWAAKIGRVKKRGSRRAETGKGVPGEILPSLFLPACMVLIAILWGIVLWEAL